MSKVAASKDFKTFVTLDDAGSAYFLREIENPVLIGSPNYLRPENAA